MRGLSLPVVASLTVLLSAAACGADRNSSPTLGTSHGETIARPVLQPFTAPLFSLRDQDGRLVQLAKQRGHVVLVTFLYTHCPDVCPLIASRLNAALLLLSPAARSKTRVLAVSVDPEHDTPAAVHRFIAEHRLLPQFRYLTGSRARLREIWQAYNVLATPAADRVVDHSAYTALVDRRGRVRAYFDQKALTSDIAHDVQRFLRTQPMP